MVWSNAAALRGFEGFLLGLFGAALNLGGLWMGIKMFSDPRLYSDQESGVRPQTMLIVLACFVKMPIFIGACFLSWRIGMPAAPCFFAGVFSVYSCSILWVAKTR